MVHNYNPEDDMDLYSTDDVRRTCARRDRMNREARDPFEYHSMADVDADVAREARERELRDMRSRKSQLVLQYGTDRYEDETVLTFSRQFTRDGKRYTYAAIRANGKWYTTGERSGVQGATWLDFVLWLVSGEMPVSPSMLTRMREDLDA